MLIKTLEVGHLGTNCYIVADEDSLECAVIDAGDECNTIMDYIEDNHLKCKCIFLTHGHFDHVGAAQSVMEETGATVYIHELDSYAKTGGSNYGAYKTPSGTVMYKDGDRIEVGSLVFEVIETPGHTLGGVTLRCQDALFTGDTLFRESCGRTDMAGGDMNTMMKSLKKLYLLEGDYEVYCGHMGHSTLSHEREFNYYMKCAIDR